MRNNLLLFLLTTLLYACGGIGFGDDKTQAIQQDSAKTKHAKGNLFDDDSLGIEGQRNKVFNPILDSESRKDMTELLKTLSSFYHIQLQPKTAISRCYSSQIYGGEDSVWVIETVVEKDSSCLPHGHRSQFFFDTKGHLIHSDNAATVTWIFFKKEAKPLLMTLETDCKGKGYHHFHKMENGELIDIFNVLLENTPPTYDANAADDNISYQPNELELKLDDRNKDGQQDVIFAGKKQIYKDGNLQKTESVEYTFLYEPGEDWFVLKSNNKK